MNDCVDEFPAIRDVSGKNRASIWLLRSGWTCLALAVISPALGLILAIGRMAFSFQALAEASGTPRASDVSEGIGNSLIPSLFALGMAFLFGVIGIILLIVGGIGRRPPSIASRQ